ncbi:MAG: zinc ribbon domain-containing protein, partial [Methanomassiliicoccaceae archaeon]|nr:zinc ribbon domain-containing protein [Methanomassiliicoccaceae archaeon]
MTTSIGASMDDYQKTGFQKFRETEAAPLVGMALALAISLLLVWAGFYQGMLDGLIIAVISYMILRWFRAKEIDIMLSYGAMLWAFVTLFMLLMSDNGNFFEYLYITGVVIALPYMLLCVMIWWMRKNLEKTRERLEKEGRLYPPGYGRCKRCGTIVLPGEISCRKCGEYIDVPEEMRVKKINYFECSECGREVPENVDVCPYC